MKKFVKISLCIMLMLTMALPSVAFAKESIKTTVAQGVEAPMLLEVSFNNAKIEGDFEPSVFEYNLALDNSGSTPTIKSYKISTDAQAFVTDIVGSTSQQKVGVNIEVKNGNVSTNYAFMFANADVARISSNNYLDSFNCEFGEVYPKLNEKDTEYSLYIPSDLTELKLNATTQDVGATCSAPNTITLNPDQNPVIEVTVVASDMSTRVYKFNVKRLSKNTSQVKAQMESDDFISLVKGELFYQKPEFKIVTISIVAGLCFVIIMFYVLRRLTLKAYDENDTGVMIINKIDNIDE